MMSASLGERLAALGLRPVARVRVTDNRTVLVSLSRLRVLSVHRVFEEAPDDVLGAIVRFVAPGTSRERRKEEQRAIVNYYKTKVTKGTKGTKGPVRRPDRVLPADRAALDRLALLFAGYNQRHFRGSLPAIPIRLSGRMRTRLGHLLLDAAGTPQEITISRRHLAKHAWTEVEHTLLHEMVHLWQCAEGHAVDHGPVFRAKARETGVTAAARRWVNAPRTRRSVFPTPHAPRATHHEPVLTSF